MGFPFLDLPSEIRQDIYTSILVGQVVHCRADDKDVYRLDSSSDEAHKRHQQLNGGIPGDFDDEFMYGSKNEYHGLTRAVKWTNNTMPRRNLPSPSDILSFLLSCKKVWHELEPLMWKYMNFCLGLPQFAGFYKHFLAQKRTKHSITTPRAELLQRVSLSLIQESILGSTMGRDHRYRHVDCYDMVANTNQESMKYLAQKCTSLQDLSILVDVATMDAPGPGGLPLDLEDSHIILLFRPVKTFKLMTSGHINHSATFEERVNRASAPSNHPTLLTLEAAESALTAITTRTHEPSLEAPPEGIEETDEDYVWLRTHCEKNYGKHPRLVELLLQTRVYLENLGVTFPRFGDGNL